MQKLRSIGFILVGAVAGVLISLNFQAIADRAARTPLPIEELRAFTEVFGAIKTNYVEPVEDKKLITEAINGMLTGLDPHSAFLSAMRIQCRSMTQSLVPDDAGVEELIEPEARRPWP